MSSPSPYRQPPVVSADEPESSRSRYRPFTLSGWLRRHHRERVQPANLRAGIDSPPGYPFEPRY
jgi:hypothetical protein